MMNNNIIRILIIVIQGAIGHYADLYRPTIMDAVGIVGYSMIFVTVIVTLICTLGFFKKENC